MNHDVTKGSRSLEIFSYFGGKSISIPVSELFFLVKQKTVVTLTQPTQLEQYIAIISTNRLGTTPSDIHSPLILPICYYHLHLLMY